MADLAGDQFGRITWGQLREFVGEATIARWTATGYLWEKLPGVYGVGHAATSTEADLMAAVLFAGPDAALSHATAAWWYGWLSYPVAAIHVSTPRRCRSLADPLITVHARRQVEGVTHNGIPVTTIPQTMLDLAASSPIGWVRKALAELDYQEQLDIADLQAACGNGRKGSTKLRLALSTHMPELARTRSDGEDRFLFFCEAQDLPIPQVNRKLFGVRADFHWPQFKLVAFLDGVAAHRSPERVRRDRSDELILRSNGLTVVRYEERLIDGKPLVVRADLVAHMPGWSQRPGAILGEAA